MIRSKRKPRKARKRMLILCEGATEKNYFQAIKEDPAYKQALSAVDPEVIAAKNPTPEQVVKEAVQRVERAGKDNNPYDSVWVVLTMIIIPTGKALTMRRFDRDLMSLFLPFALKCGTCSILSEPPGFSGMVMS